MSLLYKRAPSPFSFNLIFLSAAITSFCFFMYLGLHSSRSEMMPESLIISMKNLTTPLELYKHPLTHKTTYTLPHNYLDHINFPPELDSMLVCTPYVVYTQANQDPHKHLNKAMTRLGKDSLNELPSGAIIPLGKKWIICHYHQPWHIVALFFQKNCQDIGVWALFMCFILHSIILGYLQYRQQRTFHDLLKNSSEGIPVPITHLKGPWKTLLEEALIIIYALQNRLNDDQIMLDDSEIALTEASENMARAEAKIIHQEKLAQLGTLTASVAHELRNPLNYILNFASLSESQLERLKDSLANMPLPPSLETLMLNTKKTIEHAQRANRIISSSLLQARREDSSLLPHFDRVSINPILREYKNLCSQHFKRLYPDIPLRVELSLDPSTPDINVVDEDMHYIVVNILNNAFEAIIDFYSSKPSQSYKPFIDISSEKKDSEVVICLRDNGPGIPATHLRRICQPFFTTKRKGTGLGLFITQTCVERNKGLLSISSNPGKGTCVMISFPLPNKSVLGSSQPKLSS